jgi:hypothetical protein
MPRTGTFSLVAIAGGGAAIVLAAAVGLTLAVRGCTRDETQAAAPAANDPAVVGNEGMRAKGTDELRQLGCDHAVVVDMARLLGGSAHPREDEPRLMVTCDVGSAASPPSCERVALTYFSAIGGTAEDRVGVRVTREGSTTPTCSRLYAPNGVELGAF